MLSITSDLIGLAVEQLTEDAPVLAFWGLLPTTSPGARHPAAFAGPMARTVGIGEDFGDKAAQALARAHSAYFPKTLDDVFD